MRTARTLAPGILPVVALDRKNGKPIYRQLYEGYRDAIVERRLKSGQRLPSTRGLAAELQISRIPVLNAFDQLLAEGYLESRPGAGTFVAGSLPEAISRPARQAPPARSGAPVRPARRSLARRSDAIRRGAASRWLEGREPFHCPSPPLDQFPVKVWASLVAHHARRPEPGDFHYQPAMGLTALRETVAEYLRTSRAVRCDADQILIVNGSQSALDLTVRVLLDEGSAAWVEDPGYFGTHQALRLGGARIVPVPVDDEGLDVDAGIALFPRPRAVFVTPSHEFPLGVTMSASRRMRLLEWADHHGAWIVEDDYDGEYRYGNLPIASLQGLDRGSRVIYVGTFTKNLFPSLRLGYVVLPRDLVSHFAATRRAMDFFTPLFFQRVLADFIREGHFDRHLRRTRLVCRERREALVAALDRHFGARLRVIGDRAGMFLTVLLPRGLRDEEIAARAAERGVRTFPLSPCYLGRPRRQGLVLGYGGVPAAAIPEAVERLRAAFPS
jgi:GntR family transcriptional regulator/MocR family aminotransferase